MSLVNPFTVESSMLLCGISSPMQCHGPRLGIDVSRIDCIDIQLLSAGVTNIIQTQAVRGITEEVV